MATKNTGSGRQSSEDTRSPVIMPPKKGTAEYAAFTRKMFAPEDSFKLELERLERARRVKEIESKYVPTMLIEEGGEIEEMEVPDYYAKHDKTNATQDKQKSNSRFSAIKNLFKRSSSSDSHKSSSKADNKRHPAPEHSSKQEPVSRPRAHNLPAHPPSLSRPGEHISPKHAQGYAAAFYKDDNQSLKKSSSKETRAPKEHKRIRRDSGSKGRGM